MLIFGFGCVASRSGNDNNKIEGKEASAACKNTGELAILVDNICSQQPSNPTALTAFRSSLESSSQNVESLEQDPYTYEHVAQLILERCSTMIQSTDLDALPLVVQLLGEQTSLGRRTDLCLTELSSF